MESWALGFGIKFPKLSDTTLTPSSIKPPCLPKSVAASQSPSCNHPDDKKYQNFIIHSTTIPISFLVALIGASQWWARSIVWLFAWGVLSWTVTGILWLCDALVGRFQKVNIEISRTDIFDKPDYSERKPVRRKTKTKMQKK